jgi:NADH dehydrogenase [ubiquinone] 1 alpha subcomplex assembly factor 7
MDDLPSLDAEIRHRIAKAGPMPVSEYMALCLTHPKYGYYTAHDPFGTRGDFITAPEVSQMFGELIGLWMAAIWKQAGSPGNIHIVELGPGRGTLMKDALRAVHVMPGFRDAITLHLVEISPVLRAQQERSLDAWPAPISWYQSLREVPSGPSIVIANEFFDALPVHQAVKSVQGWHERQIEINSAGQLAFVLAPNPIPHFEKLLPAALRDAGEGAFFEWRSDGTIMELGLRIARDGIAALVIDYGHSQSDLGDTLQAIGQHTYADPLTASGSLDLTAHVDFQALVLSAEAMGAQCFGPLDQGKFLMRLGIKTRAEILKGKATPTTAKNIDSAFVRLTGQGHTGMGSLFKVMAFAHNSLGVPPAFER